MEQATYVGNFEHWNSLVIWSRKGNAWYPILFYCNNILGFWNIYLSSYLPPLITKKIDYKSLLLSLCPFFVKVCIAFTVLRELLGTIPANVC